MREDPELDNKSIQDDKRCPGTFHTGCNIAEPTEDPTMDPTYDPTTIDPEPTTTAPEKKCEPMKEVCDSYLNIARRIIYVILIYYF